VAGRNRSGYYHLWLRDLGCLRWFSEQMAEEPYVFKNRARNMISQSDEIVLSQG